MFFQTTIATVHLLQVEGASMPRRRAAITGITCLLAALVLTAPAQAIPGAAPDRASDAIDVYTGSIQPGQLSEFRRLGLDHEDVRTAKEAEGRLRVEAVISARQAKALRSKGITLSLKTIKGVPASAALRQKALAGQTVY